MYKISIPQPCQEKWEEMTPQGQGAFCGQCSKVVIDFTKMSDEEVQNYFIQHAHEKLCGRFKKEQLNDIRIEIPSYVIYKEPNFLKKFMLISLVVFGTTLYSCTDSNGAATEKAEFVINNPKDTVPKTEVEIGKIAVPKETTKKSCDKNEELIVNGGISIVEERTEKGEIAISSVDTVKKVCMDTNTVVVGQYVTGAPLPVPPPPVDPPKKKKNK